VGLKKRQELQTKGKEQNNKNKIKQQQTTTKQANKTN